MKLTYRQVMNLGFTETLVPDTSYEEIWGFPLSIITLHLSPLKYLEWLKETQVVRLVELDHDGSIKALYAVKTRFRLNSLLSLRQRFPSPRRVLRFRDPSQLELFPETLNLDNI